VHSVRYDVYGEFRPCTDQNRGLCYSDHLFDEKGFAKCYRQKGWLGNECFAHEDMTCVSVRKVSQDGVAGQVHSLRQWSVVELNR